MKICHESPRRQIHFSGQRKYLAAADLEWDEVNAFFCDGTRGSYIHLSIWREGIFPTAGRQLFLDPPGRIHGRVNADIGVELGAYLSVPPKSGLEQQSWS